MKVKDLLIELQKADPEADLVFSHGDGCCGDREWLILQDAEFDEHLQFNLKSELVRSKNVPHGTFEFYFETPYYLTSCRKSGAVRDLIRKMDEDTAAWHKSQKEKNGKRIRRVGDIMLDIEKLLFELHIDHDMQHYEVIYMINGWQKVHVPQQIETYKSDGSHPVLYGPKPERKKRAKKPKK